VIHCSGAQQAPQNLPLNLVGRDQSLLAVARAQRSLLRKSGEMRKHALPSPVALHKNICCPFPRAELLPHEFSLRPGYRGNYCAVFINADSETFGFHYVMRQHTRFDHLEKARPINYFSVRINYDPVICHKPSDAFEIVVNDCLRERVFEFQKFFFDGNSYT
jgi:hypothetical protein